MPKPLLAGATGFPLVSVNSAHQAGSTGRHRPARLIYKTVFSPPSRLTIPIKYKTLNRKFRAGFGLRQFWPARVLAIA
jgi:hypothetical protein